MMFKFFDQSKIQKQANDTMFNTETMLAVSEIKNDTIIMKDSGLRAILKIDGLNLDLKNTDELNIVLEQYKRFLNGLDFPIQIVVRNNYLDLSDYLNYINGNLKEIINPVLKKQGEKYLSFLEDIDSKQGMIYNKDFYVVIPYYEGEQDQSKMRKGWFDKFLDVLAAKDSVEQIVARHRAFLKGKNMLDSRCNLVVDGLAGLGIPVERTTTSDIISLLFSFYNPLLHSSQSKVNVNDLI